MTSSKSPAATAVAAHEEGVTTVMVVAPEAAVPEPWKYVFTVPVRVPAVPSCPGVAQTNGCTTVITVAVLFVLTGSVVVELTVAEFESVLAATGVVTLIVSTALAFCASVFADASEQVTKPATFPQVHPAGPLAEINV